VSSQQNQALIAGLHHPTVRAPDSLAASRNTAHGGGLAVISGGAPAGIGPPGFDFRDDRSTLNRAALRR
jgi:hypothetical protein